ncbi:MAG: ABC transporter permease [Oligosphaeraceae bacterium]
MLPYLLRRILYLLPILLGVNLLVFAMFFLVNSPEDMARQALGEKADSPQAVENWKEVHGYHLPLLFHSGETGMACLTETIFYQKSLAMFWGNFGASDATGKPIAQELRNRVAPSFVLALPIFLGTLAINLILGMKLAAARGTPLDHAGQFLCVTLMSVSTLILIILGQYLGAQLLRLSPVSGFARGPSMLRFLLLPALVGIVAGIGSGTRLFRTFFLEQLSQDYVRTARAKGLPENQVLFRHVLRNTLIPVVTNIPLYLLTLFTGNLLLEKFFAIPGLGGYTMDAIAAQDFAVVRAMVFLGAVLYSLGLLMADVAYALVDPRIHY